MTVLGITKSNISKTSLATTQRHAIAIV